MTNNNPCDLNGFEFLEFSGPGSDFIKQYLLELGFTKVATHKRKLIDLYRQGQINFLLNREPSSQASKHAETHGPGACAMGFRVKDAKKAYEHVLDKGAKPFQGDFQGDEVSLKAIEAIAGSVIYFIDDGEGFYSSDFDFETNELTNDTGLLEIDHLTHNVHQGNMDKWADFYTNLFNFSEIRYFDIKGKMTGLVSRAMGSPCGKIKIPLNESKDDKSQIEEFLHEYNGEGIQHIALSTETIYESCAKLKENGINFLDVPDTYYEMIQNRIPWHQEPLAELQKHKLLVDGEKTPEHGLLIQIFTQNIFGPAFFEIIQRKGNEGFGEGNFQALFEAIERDQVRRGVLEG